MKKFYLSAAVIAASLALPAVPALAQANEIVIGITIVTTGPAAALGIPERNALEFVPKEIGGVPLKLIVLDDGGDPTAATTNARRFVTESKADIIMGSSTTPPTIAVSTVANEAGIPHFALAPLPINEARMKWSVAMPQPIPIMGKVLYEHMKAHGIKTVGYIGYSDSYGDLWFNDFKAQAVPMGIALATEERYARTDTSVTGQVLKLLAANPDAVLVGGSGTAAALPQAALRERGYKGLIYQTHGAASMDFIRIAGAAAEGVIMSSGPVMSPETQPDSALTKKPGLALNTAYEAKYGANSRSQFAGHSYDAFEVLKRVIPPALKAGKPGTPEFREGIRQALLTERDIAASQGVYNFTEKDRYGLDDRSRIILTVNNGKYVPAK
ncbi:ABC transporter substrate-binding protein [Bradyrhizobium sp. AUGA SZCCT0240]|jgi:branched-chain amino acid transport system substrate-binding protein|uniref:ABC transporter substrate-binding protein n=1 Tax=unclassified Bradyrhizobium TaxID=2631580 RepID=UPI00178B67E7|nr:MULTISPECIES: ABC transporter substrate-binding protein [unclassified Bradyrhizobium]MBR1192282.1 ABC transporter substrate-binding protein [Bradyrhizobium sp. AUGA SZCCT0160]MBR1199747.1 ABC transporter substrate-binding protein [Bradyrhizobium sp. AUGA SZCCT0158]MBR1239411.1 ABC transporter substrate-binding protein [Bradyrhizobium sp. AUGA SZCCT0274]MBR1250500.1 ABC transporter substrate-binding protein [Bradyrhizobium sp. AUGA SZCCT0169]MBR1256731.1 ABC transporter substrate-binding pro